jgi:twitching motility protein PilJ
MQRFNVKKPPAARNDAALRNAEIQAARSTVIENPRKPVALTPKPGSKPVPTAAQAKPAPVKPRRNPKSTGEHMIANLKTTAEHLMTSPNTRNPTVSLEGSKNALTKFLENSRMILKIALIATIPLLGMVAAALVSNNGFGVLRYQVDNLYSFMLIPITELNKAEIGLSDLQGQVGQLGVASMPSVVRDELIQDFKKDITAVDTVIDRYNKEWATTGSAAFTATLRQYNKLDTQQKETEILTKANANLKIVDNSLNIALKRASKNLLPNDQVAQLRQQIKELRTNMQDLVAVNMDFAKLSFDDANSAESSTRILSLAVLGIAALLTFLAGTTVARSVSSRLGQLSHGAADLQSGDLNVNVDVHGQDEIALVAQTFNQTVHTLRAKSEEDQRGLERSRSLQNNIGEFLGVAMDVSQGNLTRRGKISNDELGSVVDAFNLMTDEIGSILKDVSKVAEQVNRRAQVMNVASSQIVQGAQSQANEANTARVQAEGVSESIRQMASGAVQNAQTAQQTLQASQAGQLAVQDTRNGLENIRTQMVDLAGGIQGLAVRSGEISDVVKTISGIASQTNLLALGAALEAAGAGDAGLRFMAVADGVRKLAEDAASSAQRVAALIKSVQSEIQGLVNRAEGGAREVEAGYAVAAKAGERLQEIATLAQQSARVAGSISNLAGQQVVGVEEVSMVVQRIASTAGQTESRSVQGQKAADELRALAEQLSTSLSRFQLPA